MRFVAGLISGMIFLVTTISGLQAEVVVDFTSDAGWIFHGAHRVNDRPLNGFGALSTHYNNQPVFAPFRSPDGVGGRYANHPGHPTNPTGFFGSLDGAGGFQFTPTGSFGSITSGSGLFSTYGSNLPAAAMSGILPVDLNLPNGLSLATGTTILADFSGLRADFNDPSQWWYDENTQTGHLTYTGGSWGFYFESSPGSYSALATFGDVHLTSSFNYATNTNTLQWTATPQLTGGLILPTTGLFDGGTSILLPIAGVLNEEMVSPTVGIFGRGSFTMPFRFDVENATVPEPTAFMLCSPAFLFLMVTRRQRAARST